MQRLIDLVEAYRRAKTVEERVHCAETILSAVGPELRAFVLRRFPVDSADQAEDVFLETLEGISKNLLQFHGTEDEQLWDWCYSVARYKVYDRRRREAVEPQPIDPDELWRLVDASAEEEPLSHGERLDLEYAMNLLRSAKPPCCGYLEEFYLLDWDYTEIAQAHGLSYDNARRRVERCLELAQKLVNVRP